MDSSETMATFGQQDIGRRQTNHNTEIQKAMMSNTDTTNTGGEIRLSLTCLFTSCIRCTQLLPVSPDCPLLIAPSVFSNAYYF
jgi:hypothetical protein